MCFGGQRMFPRPAGTVDPPDLAVAAPGGKFARHGGTGVRPVPAEMR